MDIELIYCFFIHAITYRGSNGAGLVYFCRYPEVQAQLTLFCGRIAYYYGVTE